MTLTTKQLLSIFAPPKQKSSRRPRRAGATGRRLETPGILRTTDANSITSLMVYIPTEIQSSPNQRLHWRAASALKKKQREAVASKLIDLELPDLPVDVRITRLYAGRQREFDDDNATAGAKAIRDEIAAQYGVDDKDKANIRFVVDQAKADTACVRIRIVRREVSDIPLLRDAAASVALDETCREGKP